MINPYLIRRILPPLVAVLALALLVWLLFLRGGEEAGGPRYKLVFDNAFGLTPDTELRSAGVPIGKVASLDVQRKTGRAIVEVEVEKTDFGTLRTDARCSIDPQSLIGEYFVDCQPGEDGRKLADGATLGPRNMTGTIPPDLVQSIMQRPQRERFGIILSEFGAAFGARGPELDQTIRRAVPALRETERVLETLGQERSAIERLARDGDVVFRELAAGREGIADFVAEGGDAAAAAASRREDLRTTLRRLPALLRELRPTMRDLGRAADAQTPALRDLRTSAGDLERLLGTLGPFSRAARPAIDGLADASVPGRRAARSARPVVAQLRDTSGALRDPMQNLAVIARHLNDRDFAVEPSKTAPVPSKGYTGAEAFLQYIFRQAQAINIFDSRGHILKLNVLISECAQYRDAASVREGGDHEELAEECQNNVGQGPRPGIDDDIGKVSSSRSARSAAKRDRDRESGDRRDSTSKRSGRERRGAGPSEGRATAERRSDDGARRATPSARGQRSSTAASNAPAPSSADPVAAAVAQAQAEGQTSTTQATSVLDLLLGP